MKTNYLPGAGFGKLKTHWVIPVALSVAQRKMIVNLVIDRLLFGVLVLAV